MKTLLITLLLLGISATQVMGGQLNFLRADASVFSFKSDGSLGLKRPPVRESSANPVSVHGLAIAKDSADKLWTNSDQVNISGNVISVSSELGLVFHNDSTGDSVLLTNTGNLEANVNAEANLTRVDMYLDNHVIETDIATNQTKEYCGFGDGRIEYDSSGATERFYLKDHLGSTRAVIDENGTLVETVSYDAYGAIIRSEISAGVEEPTKEKFTGKEYDTSGYIAGIASGLQLDYFGARYYDPEIGVWTSTDPKEQFGSPYKYAGNGTNPVIFVDKDGTLLAAFLIGYIRYGLINNDWGTQALKAGIWTNIGFSMAAKWGPALFEVSQGVANVIGNKAQGFGANVGQYFMGAGEGLLDYANTMTLGLLNQPISQGSGYLRGYAYNTGLGITGDAAKLNISEAQKMNETFGNYIGQGALVKAGADFTWGFQGGPIGWENRYVYARAKRLYLDAWRSGDYSEYENYMDQQKIKPEKIEMMDWSYKQGKWIPQFGHALGGTVFSHAVMYDAFETYGEPYEAHNIQDYSDDWGLWQWWKDYH